MGIVFTTAFSLIAGLFSALFLAWEYYRVEVQFSKFDWVRVPLGIITATVLAGSVLSAVAALMNLDVELLKDCAAVLSITLMASGSLTVSSWIEGVVRARRTLPDEFKPRPGKPGNMTLEGVDEDSNDNDFPVRLPRGGEVRIRRTEGGEYIVEHRSGDTLLEEEL